MPNKADGTPHDGDLLRREALQRYNISLGTGLGRLAGKAFRIGHLGDTNALTIIGALAAVEMTFAGLGMPHQGGGVQAAMRELT
jgi:alanine-glyoxylate transaminase/serine-glyoxylate transaminase/serine-pyruvate transaminase